MSYLQLQWTKVYNVLGDDYYNYHVYGTLFVFNLVYWSIGGVFALLDYSLKPEWIRKFKV